MLKVVFGAACALAAVSARASVALYEHDDFAGRSIAIHGRTTDLQAVGFNDTASSAVVNTGYWQFCADADFRGECIVLGPGRHASLRAHNLNDRLSSLRQVMPPPGAGGAVELFEHTQRGGRVWRGSAAVGNLHVENFNDLASSVVVRGGNWELCTDAEFRGRCVVLAPGLYADLVSQGLNDAFSSLRPSAAAPTPGITGSPLAAGPGAGVPVPGGARPATDDSLLPEITFTANRTARVSYAADNCVVFYGAAGRRLQAVPACDSQQIARADDLMARFRREFGMNRQDAGNPWVAAGLVGAGAAAGKGLPSSPSDGLQLIIETDRSGEVSLPSGCVAQYSAFGRRVGQNAPCTADQLRRADEAMATYRRDSGL